MNTTYCCSCANVLFAELRLVVSEFNSIPTCAWLTRYFFAFFDLCTQYPPLRTSLQYFQENRQRRTHFSFSHPYHSYNRPPGQLRPPQSRRSPPGTAGQQDPGSQTSTDPAGRGADAPPDHAGPQADVAPGAGRRLRFRRICMKTGLELI